MPNGIHDQPQAATTRQVCRRFSSLKKSLIVWRAPERGEDFSIFQGEPLRPQFLWLWAEDGGYPPKSERVR
jgi:hypothetical protein